MGIHTMAFSSCIFLRADCGVSCHYSLDATIWTIEIGFLFFSYNKSSKAGQQLLDKQVGMVVRECMAEWGGGSKEKPIWWEMVAVAHW